MNLEQLSRSGVLGQDRRSTRLTRVRDGAVAGYTLYQFGITFWNQFEGRFARKDFSVSINEYEDLFDEFQRWMVQQVPPEKIRELSVYMYYLRTVSETGVSGEYVLGAEKVDEGTLDLEIGGHPIQVSFQSPEGKNDKEKERAGGTRTGTGNASIRRKRGGSLVLKAHTLEGRKAVIRHLDGLLEAYNAKSASSGRVFCASSYGEWKQLYGPRRELDTVVLRDGQMEGLVRDIEAFLDLEETYGNLGQPYHRGYLLHGPPGTGKSSLFHALASHLELDLYYLPLTDLDRDMDLIDLFNNLTGRSILLIEDVDTLSVSQGPVDNKTSQDTKRSITLTGMLQALDGVVTPHGMILGMTSNHPELIDPRLIREGRIDYRLAVDYLCAEQLARLVHRLTGVEVKYDDFDSELRLTASEVVGIIKRYLYEDDGNQLAVREIGQLVEERRTVG